MKTSKYNPSSWGIIKGITLLLSFQVALISESKPIIDKPENQILTCVTCIKISHSALDDVSSNDLISLSPTAPAEATFTEETTLNEVNLVPTTPEEASFEDDPEWISTLALENLAPQTPIEADFND